MKKIIVLLALVLSILIYQAYADSEDGGYAGAFLQAPILARPAGMGGAFLAIPNDAAAQLYNPAGMSTTQKRIFSSSYRIMKLDRKLGFVTLAIPTKLQSAIAVSWLYAGYGEVAARDKNGWESGTTISSSEHDFGLTFAKQFTPFLNIGTKLNFYYKKVSTLKANSVGINLGALVTLDSMLTYGSMERKPLTDINFGLVLNHLSAKYPWAAQGEQLTATQDDKFPMSIGLGASCRAFKRNLLLAADFEKNEKQSAVARFGGEYTIDKKFLLRSGLNNGALTAGAGFRFVHPKTSFGVDCAWQADRADEGSDFVVSLQFMF